MYDVYALQQLDDSCSLTLLVAHFILAASSCSGCPRGVWGLGQGLSHEVLGAALVLVTGTGPRTTKCTRNPTIPTAQNLNRLKTVPYISKGN